MEVSFGVDLKLSSKGFQNFPFELHEGDFEFVIGNQIYKCNSIVAEFLSPKISKLRILDPSFSRYELEAQDLNSKFNEFISLVFDSHLHVGSKDFDFFVSVSKELENEEILSQLINSFISSTELTVSNAVKMLKLRQMICCEGEDEREISFIASKMSEIEDLCSLEIHQLRSILSHSSLRIESEDWLYNFISSLISKDKRFGELLEFVHFEFLNKDSIEHFIKSSPSFIFDNFNLPIWNSICLRLLEKPLIKSVSHNLQETRFGKVLLEDEVDKEVKQRKQTESELSSLRKNHEILNS